MIFQFAIENLIDSPVWNLVLFWFLPIFPAGFSGVFSIIECQFQGKLRHDKT